MDGWVNGFCCRPNPPDMVVNLEQFPWPFEDNSVGEISLNHVLEHLGELRDVYWGLLKSFIAYVPLVP